MTTWGCCPARDMLEAALQQLGWKRERGCYELSVGNPDKGVLPVEEVLRRLQQFTAEHLPIVVTHVSNAGTSLCC